MGIPVFVFLAGIMLFSGCLEKVTIEDRLACLELSSYAFTEVPECTSQDACFTEVETAFPFNESVFSTGVQSELHGTKNRLARAWLFLNRARNNLKIINNQCYLAKDYSQLPRQVNELNSNLVTVGKEIDSFNKAAVKAVHFEINALENDDVNLMKEHPLYDDYILLNQNVADFSQKNLFNDTYASRFLLEAEKFNTIAEALGLQETVRETTLFSLISANEKTLAKEARKRDFPVSFIEPFFSAAANFLKDLFSVTDSVSSLRALPSFEFFSSVNGLISRENSSASAFYAMFANDASHRRSVGEGNALGRQEIFLALASAEKKSLDFAKNYGSDFFPELFSPEDSFALEGVPFQVSELDDFASAVQGKKSAVEASLRELDEAEFLGRVSLGEKTLRLNRLRDSAQSLLDETMFAETLVGEARETCSEKLLEMKNSLSMGSFDSDNPVVVSLRSRVTAQISSFEDTPETSFCSGAIKDYAGLLDAAERVSSGEEYLPIIENCISEASSLLVLSGSKGLGLRLTSLESLGKPYSNPDLVLDSCLELKGEIENSVRSSPEMLSVESSYAGLRESASIIESLSENFPELRSSKRAGAFLGEFGEISESFERGRLLLGEFARRKEIGSALSSLAMEAPSLVRGLASEAVESSLETEILDGNGFARVFLFNPGLGVPVDFEAAIELGSENAELVFSTGNIGFSPAGNKTLLRFSSLLPGLNSIILDLNSSKVLPGEKESSSQENKALVKSVSAEKERLVHAAEAIGKDAATDFIAEKIDFFAEQGKLEKASEELAKLDEHVKKLKADSEAGLERERIGVLRERSSELKESVSENLGALRRDFGSVDSQELAEVYAFSPITLERVNELGSLLSAPEPASEKELESHVERLEEAESESRKALEKLKENSLSSYNVAVSERNSAVPDTEADALLLKSRSALESKSYLESMLNSKRASDVLRASPSSPGFEVPLAVYPLLLVVLGVLLYVYRKSEEGKRPKPVVKVKKLEP